MLFTHPIRSLFHAYIFNLLCSVYLQGFLDRREGYITKALSMFDYTTIFFYRRDIQKMGLRYKKGDLLGGGRKVQYGKFISCPLFSFTLSFCVGGMGICQCIGRETSCMKVDRIPGLFGNVREVGSNFISGYYTYPWNFWIKISFYSFNGLL